MTAPRHGVTDHVRYLRVDFTKTGDFKLVPSPPHPVIRDDFRLEITDADEATRALDETEYDLVIGVRFLLKGT